MIPLKVARTISPDGLAYILDMDGVIVDSHEIHVEAWERYLRRHHISASDLGPRMHGKHNGELVRELFGPQLTDTDVHAHGAAKEALYRDMMRPQLTARLVRGLTAFLSQHAEPAAVASNAEPANLDFVLDGAGLRGRFRVVVDGHQVTRPKPDPEIFLRAAALLGFEPGRCIVFEDSAPGIQAARAAGMRVVAVNTAHAPLPPADLTVADFSAPELPAWLARSC